MQMEDEPTRNWVIEVDNELYFAPASYLDQYAKEQGRKIKTIIWINNIPEVYANEILKGHILVEKNIEYLEKMTGVSKQTWRNLDETWQKGKAKYLYRNNNKK